MIFIGSMSKLAKQGGNFGNVISGLFLLVGSSFPDVDISFAYSTRVIKRS